MKSYVLSEKLGGTEVKEVDRNNAVAIASNQQSFNYTAIADGIVVAINNGTQSGLTITVNGVAQSGYVDANYGAGGMRIMVLNVSAGDLISCQSTLSGWNWGAAFYPYAD